jgi:hypothetical protein
MRDALEAHNRIKELDWPRSYVQSGPRYPTKYKIPRKTKDPFRHLLREYFSMEEEKDARQYGALEDALARSKAAAKAEPRWIEILKAVLPILSFGEYGAIKCMGQLIDTVENAELRQGYLAQMLDEVRHANQEAYLTRYLARHAVDPEGFAQAFRVRGPNPLARASRAALEAFFVGDPIECALNLQVVAETAYTNAVFVAMTEVAAKNGDPVTPTVFLSIQSDEARHMANGYATLAAVVSCGDNLPDLQRDFDRAFWRQHSFLDPFIGAVYDYFQARRCSSYGEKWQQWIAGDWVESYIARLEPFGLKTPRWFQQAQRRVPWIWHTTAMVVFATWPLHFWRFEPLSPEDMEWFESKYPGWYRYYGRFWEEYRRLCDPAAGASSLSLLPCLPPLCRVCQLPCVFPRPDANEARRVEFAGRAHAFCSAACEEIFQEEPQRYLGYRTWYELFDGCDLAEYVAENGLLRADGKTLIGQPWLNTERMWTIDEIRSLGVEIRNPLG